MVNLTHLLNPIPTLLLVLIVVTCDKNVSTYTTVSVIFWLLLSNSIKAFEDIENFGKSELKEVEELLIDQGHNLSGIQWMIHADPTLNQIKL